MQATPHTSWKYCTSELAHTSTNWLLAMQLSAALRAYSGIIDSKDRDMVRHMNLLLLGSFLNNWN